MFEYVQCLLGHHEWVACGCKRCHTPQPDAVHSFHACTCQSCGYTDPTREHTLIGCVCRECGEVRHQWDEGFFSPLAAGVMAAYGMFGGMMTPTGRRCIRCKTPEQVGPFTSFFNDL